MAAYAPIVSVDEVERQPDLYLKMLIQVRGPVTRTGDKPRLGAGLLLEPSERHLFEGFRLNQNVLVRGYLRRADAGEEGSLRLTNAVNGTEPNRY